MKCLCAAGGAPQKVNKNIIHKSESIKCNNNHHHNFPMKKGKKFRKGENEHKSTCMEEEITS
jgi:hypothetical protein